MFKYVLQEKTAFKNRLLDFNSAINNIQNIFEILHILVCF
jgi:hypothetical protein